ncbi:hypothetical protein ACHAQA_005820 [Verticillium albo-atrum]
MRFQASKAQCGSVGWYMVDHGFTANGANGGNTICTFDIGAAPNLTINPPVHGDTAQQIRQRLRYTKRPKTNEVMYSIDLGRVPGKTKSPSSFTPSATPVVVAVEFEGGYEDIQDAPLDAVSSSSQEMESTEEELGPKVEKTSQDIHAEMTLQLYAAQILSYESGADIYESELPEASNQDSSSSASSSPAPTASPAGSGNHLQQQQYMQQEEQEHIHILPSELPDPEMGSNGEPMRGRTRLRQRDRGRQQQNSDTESGVRRKHGRLGLQCGLCTVM